MGWVESKRDDFFIFGVDSYVTNMSVVVILTADFALLGTTSIARI